MLSNREFSALVDKGAFPEQVAVPLDSPFTNQNGVIQNLVLERFTSAALITSVRGAIRANHTHKTDWHYSYVLSGTVWYFWRPDGSKERPEQQSFGAGTMFFTPPNVEHAMFFPEATSFLTFAKNVAVLTLSTPSAVPDLLKLRRRPFAMAMNCAGPAPPLPSGGSVDVFRYWRADLRPAPAPSEGSAASILAVSP